MNIRKYIRSVISENYPWGAANDPKAPWNDNTQYSTPTEPEKHVFKVLMYNREMAILQDQSGKKYFFYYDHIDKDDFAEYAEREVESAYRDEDGDMSIDYSDDWEVDDNVIDRYVNDNVSRMKIGKGLDDYESADFDIVEIDEPFKQEIISTFGTPGKYTTDKQASEVQKTLEGLSENLAEGVRDKEPFEKITFGVDLLKVSGTDRKGLMDIIKRFNGEKLKTDKDGVWHTYVPVDDVEEFLHKTESFSPERTSEVDSFSKFKVREKNLKDGQKITFLDYSVSESDPPMATGYLKPGFIGREKSLLKWTNANGEEKEDWIFNKQVDAFDHYHRDAGTVTGDNIKVEFGVDTNSLTDEEKERLKSLVKSFGGKIDRLFGKKGYQSSGGKNYAIFKPDFKFDEFYQEASDFDPYFAETEKGGMIAEESTEEEIVCEVRRIVRNILKNNFNKK